MMKMYQKFEILLSLCFKIGDRDQISSDVYDNGANSILSSCIYFYTQGTTNDRVHHIKNI